MYQRYIVLLWKIKAIGQNVIEVINLLFLCRTLQLPSRVESPEIELTIEGEKKKSPVCGPEDDKEIQRLLVPDIQEIRVR